MAVCGLENPLTGSEIGDSTYPHTQTPCWFSVNVRWLVCFSKSLLSRYAHLERQHKHTTQSHQHVVVHHWGHGICCRYFYSLSYKLG